MERKKVYDDVEPGLDWKYEPISIADLRKDLDRIEKMGATHVEIYLEQDHDTYGIQIDAVKERIETDKELKERCKDSINACKRHIGRLSKALKHSPDEKSKEHLQYFKDRLADLEAEYAALK